jgi:hypothetical protein
MSTSNRILVLEAAGAVALVIGAIVAVSPGDLWLRDLDLHPLWLPIIVVSARYATRGLFVSLALAGAGLAASSLAMGGTLDGFAERTENPSDLLGLTAAVLVSWVAMLHESRLGRAAQRLAEATERREQAESNLDALQTSLAYLRARHDRLDLSLTLWRNLATRLERGEPDDACAAVLELSEIRTGARAGIVQLRDGNRLTTVSSRGAWSPISIRPPDINDDATVRAAIATRLVTPAGPGATEHDSDVAAPVVDDATGAVLGVIALRGVSPTSLRAADLRDLGVLASWIAPSLARQLRKRFGKALHDLQHKTAPTPAPTRSRSTRCPRTWSGSRRPTAAASSRPAGSRRASSRRRAGASRRGCWRRSAGSTSTTRSTTS